MGQRKQFTPEFKREAVQLLESGSRPGSAIARELGIARNQLYKWQTELRARGTGAFPGPGARKERTTSLPNVKSAILDETRWCCTHRLNLPYCARPPLSPILPNRKEWPGGIPPVRASNEGLLRPRVARAQKIISPHPLLCSTHQLKGVAKVALDCAHRTSTFLSCAFCEQEGRLATPYSSSSPDPSLAEGMP
jgi:transposase